jgi:hypothetical protein
MNNNTINSTPKRGEFPTCPTVDQILSEFQTHWPTDFVVLCRTCQDVSALIDYISKLNFSLPTTSDHVQNLILCVGFYCPQYAKALMDKYFVNPLEGSTSGLTLLHIAALIGNEKLFKVARKFGMSVNQAASFGPFTNVLPIHCTIIGNQAKLFSTLALEQNYSVICINSKDGQKTDYIELGWLSFAAFCGNSTIISSLLERSPETYPSMTFVQTLVFRTTLIHLAIRGGHNDALSVLLSSIHMRKFLNDTDYTGFTPLDLAIHLNNSLAKDILVNAHTQLRENKS